MQNYGAGGKEEKERKEEKQKKKKQSSSCHTGESQQKEIRKSTKNNRVRESIEVGLQKRSYGGGVEIEMELQQVQGSPSGSTVRNAPANAGDMGGADLTPGSVTPPGGGPDNPLQYPCLENLMDRGAQWATVQGVTKSQT